MKKLYILLIVALIGFVGNAQISYPSPICASSPIVFPVFSPNISNGGTFSSFPGLVINPSTGAISPMVSTPGTYVVTYNVPVMPPDTPAMSVTTIAIITMPITPAFNPMGTVCVGSNPPVLPTISNNGVSGSWTPSIVDTQHTTTYTFTPNGGECAVSSTMIISVLSPYVPVIFAVNDFNTVYVDENNNVVSPVELYFEMTEGYTYQWSEDTSIISGATASSYLVNTASLTGATRFFRVWVTNTETGCHTVSSQYGIMQSNGVAPPNAPRNQNLPSGSTLADIVITGTGIQWYALATDRNATATPLPMSTILSDSATYYATQTINGNESLQRLPVTVHLTLEIGGSKLISLSYSPNPVKNNLNIKAATTINRTTVVNVMGQVLKTTTHNQAEIVEDMSDWSAGTYFIKVDTAEKTQFLKIVKE